MFQPIRKVMAGVAGLAALALGGSALANAATTSSSKPSTQGGSTIPAPPAFRGPAPGSAAHEDAEKAVTGTAAVKAQAAAVKAVGGGTAGAVTTDYTGRGYETTVTKSDGSKVEVHLDSSFQVLQGPGGGRGDTPPGSRGAPPSGTQGAPPAAQGGSPPAGYGA